MIRNLRYSKVAGSLCNLSICVAQEFFRRGLVIYQQSGSKCAIYYSFNNALFSVLCYNFAILTFSKYKILYFCFTWLYFTNVFHSYEYLLNIHFHNTDHLK